MFVCVFNDMVFKVIVVLVMVCVVCVVVRE